MFLTEAKALKKISQDREKGNIEKARDRALDSLKKWPDNKNLLMEAIQACFDLSDTHRAVSLLKTAIKRHPEDSSQILNYARERVTYSFNPILASFVIEILVRDRDIQGIDQILNMARGNFVEDLIKRCETRSKSFSRKNNKTGKSFVDNELLLGILYKENEQWKSSLNPLGACLENSPKDSQLIGSMLVPVERHLATNSMVKYYLGCVSSNLDHADKAEERFFQCLELDDPPLEKLVSNLESMHKKSKNFLLLTGETLIRRGSVDQGISKVKEYLAQKSGEQAGDSTNSQIDHLFPGETDRQKFAYHRLSILVERIKDNFQLFQLTGELGLHLNHVKEAVETMRSFFLENHSHITEIIEWLESDEKITMTAPAQQLLTELYLEDGNYKKSAMTANLAVEIEPSRIPSIVELIENHMEKAGHDPNLKMGLAELQAKAGNSESAEKILDSLDSNREIDSEELFRLTSEVIKHCGVNLDGVLSATEVSFRNGDAIKPVPHITQYLRENDQSSRSVVDGIYDIGKKNDEYWPLISEMINELAKEEQLPHHFRELRARANLEMGEVEKAVFEFDQLLMFEDSFRLDLIGIYEEATEKYQDNPTLHLALYQLHKEEKQLSLAAHHLSRVLELDPGQIRDILERFDKLVEADPENTRIWEELLKSAVAIKHFDLARQTLKRAISTLPDEESAGLHIYGARISMASGKTEESLRCLSVALHSPNPKLKDIESELTEIVTSEPSNAEAQYLLGETMFALGNEESALDHLVICLDLSSAYRERIKNRLEQILPRSAKPWLLSAILGKIAWEESRYDQAYRRFKQTQSGPKESLHDLSKLLKDLSDNNPDDHNLSILYARNLALEERYPEAVDILEKLVENKPETTDSVLEILYLLLEREPGQIEANRLLASIMVRCDQTEKSLEPLLHILEYTESNPSLVDEIASPYLQLHQGDTRFIIPYARLKNKLRQHEKALWCYREAFQLESNAWETILKDIQGNDWNEELADQGLLLEIDCMIEGNRMEDAFRTIKRFSSHEPSTIREIMERLSQIFNYHPKLEHFLTGCRLLCQGNMLEESKELVRKGCELLDDDQCLQLRIELADQLLSRQHEDEANEIFKDILQSPGDRGEILKKIESSHLSWVEREISYALSELDKNQLTSSELQRLIDISVEEGKAQTALRLLLHSDLEDKMRKLKLARIYLEMDKPLLTLAVADSVSISSQPDSTEIELLYMEGLASETVGNYERATSVFSRIISHQPDYRDCFKRAEKNYTRVLEWQIENQIILIEKSTNLHENN